MLYKISRYHQIIGNNLTFEELRALMLTLSDNENYQAEVKSATHAYSDIMENGDRYKTALSWIAVKYETIGSIRPVNTH